MTVFYKFKKHFYLNMRAYLFFCLMMAFTLIKLYIHAYLINYACILFLLNIAYFCMFCAFFANMNAYLIFAQRWYFVPLKINMYACLIKYAK